MVFPRAALVLAIWICLTGWFCVAQSPANNFRLGRPVGNDGWEVISQSKTFSTTTRAGLIEALASGSQDKSAQVLEEIAAQTRIKAVDLSGKRGGEFLARSFGMRSCSPTGNCESWILRQNGDKFFVILHRGAAQTFTIQPTITNGLHDIVLGMHGSATIQGLTLYRFDGAAYRRAACYDENFTILGEDGQVHNLDEPLITPCATKSRKRVPSTTPVSPPSTITP